MIDLAQAHFLHAAKPLEAVLAPHVADPRAMAWGGDELLVVDKAGDVHLVEPLYGARRLFRAMPGTIRMALSAGTERRVAFLDQDGGLRVYRLDGTLLWCVETGILASVQLTFVGLDLLVAGDTADARRVWAIDQSGASRGRARVPSRTVAMPVDGALPRLVRSLPDGLRIRDWGEPLGTDAATEHHLLVTHGRVLGVAAGGVTLWRESNADAVTVKLYDVVNTALSRDGETMALATRTGSVSVTAARPGVPRVNPSKVGGHDTPVTGLAFAGKGRWLASLAERVWIWSF